MDTLYVKAREGLTDDQRKDEVIEELQLLLLCQSTERPTVWCCGDCGYQIDRDTVHRGRWVVCVKCGATNRIDPELVLQ